MATRRFRNKRGGSWEISAFGKEVTEFWSASDPAGSEKSKTRVLSSNAEAARLVKSRIAAKLKEGFVDEKELRAEQRAAREALKARIAQLKAKAAGVPVKRRSVRKPRSTVKAKTRSKASPPPPLPPSYRKCVERYESELERKFDRGQRRSPRRAGYPSRLVLYPESRLKKARNIFRKSLIPPEDLVEPQDHGHLLPFGHDTERTWMCWDPTMRRTDGEMMICFIDGDQGDQRTNAGYDLEKILSAYRR